MPKILVPVDGSKASHRALNFAVRLAKGAAASKIHALYVHPPIDVSGKLQVYVSEKRMRQMAMEQSQWILDAIEERLRVEPVAHTVEMQEGDAAETIVRRAEELGCDAIVMGTRGMGTIAGLAMGSVSTKVVHLTSLPVTVVK